MALLTPPQRDQVGPRRRRPVFFLGSWGRGTKRGAPGWAATPWAAGVQAPSGPGWRGPRRGRGGRDRGRPCSCQASPTGCIVPRGRRAAPRAGSGRGWSGSACVRVCARRGAASTRSPLPARSRSVPLARPGRAALSRVRAPFPLPPPPPFCELVSVTGARVTAGPSGTDSVGGRRRRSRSGRSSWAPGRGTRARKPGPAEPGAGRRAVLSTGRWETFLNRGSPPTHGERGGCLLPFF